MPRVQQDLRTGVCQIEFELDEAEYAAMGRVTAHWAYLEHGIYAVTQAIARAVEIDLPTDALSLSFKRRVKALRILVEECAPDGERKRLIRLLDRTANAEQDRHKVTHAMWEWDRSNPERISASSFRPGLEFEKLFDAARLHKLADEIGQISFALEYPGGWDDAFRDMLNPDEDGIHRLHEIALANGGTCEGPPGPRGDTFYAAYFRDPDGNKLNAFMMEQGAVA